MWSIRCEVFLLSTSESRVHWCLVQMFLDHDFWKYTDHLFVCPHGSLPVFDVVAASLTTQESKEQRAWFMLPSSINYYKREGRSFAPRMADTFPFVGKKEAKKKAHLMCSVAPHLWGSAQRLPKTTPDHKGKKILKRSGPAAVLSKEDSSSVHFHSGELLRFSLLHGTKSYIQIGGGEVDRVIWAAMGFLFHCPANTIGVPEEVSVEMEWRQHRDYLQMILQRLE